LFTYLRLACRFLRSAVRSRCDVAVGPKSSIPAYPDYNDCLACPTYAAFIVSCRTDRQQCEELVESLFRGLGVEDLGTLGIVWRMVPPFRRDEEPGPTH